jgi:hypothetical protein
MKSRYFPIEFSDLSFEKQQELIEEVKEELMEQYKEEAETKFLKEKWVIAIPKAWQEAFCRIYDIDYQLWETEEEAKNFDWAFAVEQHAEEEAEKKCYEGMHNSVLEVEI